METTVVSNTNSVIVENENTDRVLILDTGTTTIEVPQTTVVLNDSNVPSIVVEISQPVIVVAGQPGPKGEPGIREEDLTYSKRVDFVSDSVLYKGDAAVGSLEADPVWRIRRLTLGADGDVTEVWASGTDAFNKVWDNRASYTYS